MGSAGKDRAGYSLRGVQGRIIDELGARIVSGALPEGAVLPREAELMESLGVSRTSLREAIKVLAAKGLLEMRQKSGTRVTPRSNWNTFDSDVFRWATSGGSSAEILDLIEMRQLLEPAAAGLAAARSTIGDLARLDDIQRRMTAATADPDAYAAADVDFHLAVFEASHNAFLSRFGLLVADFLAMSFGMQQGALGAEVATAEALEEDAQRHRGVSDAISRGDAATASQRMMDVVIDGKKNLIAAIESDK